MNTMDALPFVSLRSWSAPGRVLEAAGAPAAVVQGGPGEWDRLERALARHRGGRGAAMGFVTYEGPWWFGIFPETRELPLGEVEERHRDHGGGGPPAVGRWRAEGTRGEFEARVRAAQGHIAAGNIYQVNLAQRFSARFAGDPAALYGHLLACSPAPGSAWVDTGELQILSASPELLLRIEGREVSTRPIKGTRPRGADPREDARLAAELCADPKERAELLMITDLERNDLGRICEWGSVRVPELLRLEPFAQVQHLVSTVTGRLRAEVSPVAALAACFPGGSITGAPKRRAMEVIAALEPSARGVYTGAIGFFALDGSRAAFNVAIRTLVHEPARGELHYHVGAGITADSVPAREFEETLHKGAGLRAAVASYAAAAGATRGAMAGSRGG